MQKLPNKFEAEVFAAAPWSDSYCYASENRTKLHFYLKSRILRKKLLESEENSESNLVIPIVLLKKSLLIFNIYVAYDKNGNKIGKFSEPAGGGPPGDFYNDIRKAYKMI